MDLQLEGKRALVTGSSSGIGAAIARALSTEGALVVVHGRNEARARQIAAELPRPGFVAIGDLATPIGAGKVVDQILGSTGGLDILVNNAGAFRSMPWMASTPDAWLSTYNENVVSMVRMIHAFAPGMKAAKWGRIIQIASRAAVRPRTQMPDYSAGKAAVLNLTVSLAKDLAPFSITVNAVSPGIIITPAVETQFRQMALERGWGTDWEDIERNIVREWQYDPCVRLGRPDDVAHTVAFLSSPLAAGISGINLRVDGGGTGTLA